MITSEGQEIAVLAFVAVMTAVALVLALAVSLVRRFTPPNRTTQTNSDPKE